MKLALRTWSLENPTVYGNFENRLGPLQNSRAAVQILRTRVRHDVTIQASIIVVTTAVLVVGAFISFRLWRARSTTPQKDGERSERREKLEKEHAVAHVSVEYVTVEEVRCERWPETQQQWASRQMAADSWRRSAEEGAQRNPAGYRLSDSALPPQQLRPPPIQIEILTRQYPGFPFRKHIAIDVPGGEPPAKGTDLKLEIHKDTEGRIVDYRFL